MIPKSILVTAGPIPAYIDPIKIVTNNFKGGLAIKTAKALKDKGHSVTLLMWEGTKTSTHKHELPIIYCHDIHDYCKKIKHASNFYDAIICAAAVANLIPSNTLTNKFPSHNYKVGEKIPINFEIAPRAIDMVKKENPRCTLIGYKCLDADYDELVRAAKITQQDSHADIIFANTPKTAKHEKIAIYPDGAVINVSFNQHINLINDAICAEHYKTILYSAPEMSNKTTLALIHVKNIVKAFEQTMPNHGTVAIPFPLNSYPNAFVTTSRGHKSDPVLVLYIDKKQREVHATGKATINAPALSAAIKASYKHGDNPEDFIIVHRHDDDPEIKNLTPTHPMKYQRHIIPGTTHETKFVHEMFTYEDADCVYIPHHGCICKCDQLDIDWEKYGDTYPSRYTQQSETVQEKLKEIEQKLGRSFKDARTLEIGANFSSVCKYALDPNVICGNAINITWDDLANEEPFDAIIALNCATYLTEKELLLMLTKGKYVFANAPATMPSASIRDRECATKCDNKMMHTLILKNNSIMTHTFYNREIDQYRAIGFDCTPYGKNSVMLTQNL